MCPRRVVPVTATPQRPFWARHRSFMVLPPLRWCCVDCVIHHEWDVREEQHIHISGANKQ